MTANELIDKYEVMISMQKEMIRIQGEQLERKDRIIALQERMIENYKNSLTAVRAILQAARDGKVQ